MSDGPYAHEVGARWESERDAQKKGYPLTKKDEALERGYVEGDDA